jgi:Uma2 family endonuclease
LGENFMPVLVTDPDLESHLINDRKNGGDDRFDEVWEGVYIMAPLPNDEHQDLQANFVAALKDLFGWDSLARIRAGVNVSDRAEGWTHNYRCPDVAVFLPGNPAINHGTHWQGGPDFLVEIVSTGDQSAAKLPFYESIGVREVLFVHRNPWRLELRAAARMPAALEHVGTASLDANAELHSTVLPVTFQLIGATPRPNVRIALTPGAARTDSGRTSWLL